MLINAAQAIPRSLVVYCVLVWEKWDTIIALIFFQWVSNSVSCVLCKCKLLLYWGTCTRFYMQWVSNYIVLWYFLFSGWRLHVIQTDTDNYYSIVFESSRVREWEMVRVEWMWGRPLPLLLQLPTERSTPARSAATPPSSETILRSTNGHTLGKNRTVVHTAHTGQPRVAILPATWGRTSPHTTLVLAVHSSLQTIQPSRSIPALNLHFYKLQIKSRVTQAKSSSDKDQVKKTRQIFMRWSEKKIAQTQKYVHISIDGILPAISTQY